MIIHWLWFLLSFIKDKGDVDDGDNDNSLSPQKFKETDNKDLTSVEAVLISTPV